MFDRKSWKHGENVTVKQMCDFMQENIPGDAIFCVCGDSQVYTHLEQDGSAFSVDDCSLSDLEEYEDSEPEELVVTQ